MDRHELDLQFAMVKRIWRENRCLKYRSIAAYRSWITRFTTYCQSRSLDPNKELNFDGVSAFARWYSRKRRIDSTAALCSARSALRAWALALETLGERISPWQPMNDPPLMSPLLQEFIEYLREHRGNSSRTLHKKCTHISMFMAFLRARGRSARQIRLQDIDAFVIACRQHYSRSTVADFCSSIRSFIRFLRISGRIVIDLAASISAPIVRPSERPHRALVWDDVRRILCAVDRSTPCGKRDYALLLMMSAYGLGAGEAIRLTLDDIAWRARTLHVVRPKTGAEFLLPLMPAIARALASYLRNGRPQHAQTRHLFVTMRAPHRHLAGSTTIRHILHKHAHRAGVSTCHLGTHVLRHSHARQHLEIGTTPKLIGDILGHRDAESTSVYLRISTERLRELALPVPL